MATPRIFRVWWASRIFDFYFSWIVFSKYLAQSSASGNPIDSFHPLGVALKNRSKIKKWSESIIRGFWKSAANLICDLLIFDPGPITHFYSKKKQIEQKVIIVFTENWKEIGLWFWHIWIARWLFLILAIFR